MPSGPDDILSEGCEFEVPNTIVVYTAKLSSIDYLSKVMARFHRENLRSESEEEALGFMISRHYQQSSIKVFSDAFTEDGIYALRYVGHGDREKTGLIADPQTGATVGPKDVHPPYKLRQLTLMACFSAEGVVTIGGGPGRVHITHYWYTHVSDAGSFTGFIGAATAWSSQVDWNNQGKPLGP